MKISGLFSFEHEPVQERPSEFAKSGHAVGRYHRTHPSGRSAPASAAFERDLPNPRDQQLSALAVAWLASFPAARRPAALGSLYPRIANRLALCWADRKLVTAVIDDLLTDKRGGRKGFPTVVRRELLALRKP